jgi:hypothetical protein
MVTCVVLQEDSGLSIGLANEGGSIRRYRLARRLRSRLRQQFVTEWRESNESKRVFDVPLTLSVPDTVVSDFREWRCSQLHKPILVTQLEEDGADPSLHHSHQENARCSLCPLLLCSAVPSY